MSANKFLRSEDGASMTEFLLVIPLLLVMTFAVIDMGLLMWQWNQAAKATHMGARMAVTRDPVATGINVYSNPGDTAWVGKSCTNPDGSARTYGDPPAALCPLRESICTSTSCSTFGYDSGSFTLVYDAMHQVLPILQPENVRIIYSSVGLGFVDRPGGSPVAVTVSLQCLTMPLIWLDLFFGAQDGCPDTGGAPIPAFATTLVGEDLAG